MNFFTYDSTAKSVFGGTLEERLAQRLNNIFVHFSGRYCRLGYWFTTVEDRLAKLEGRPRDAEYRAEHRDSVDVAEAARERWEGRTIRLTRLEWLAMEQKDKRKAILKCPYCSLFSACGFEDSVMESFGRHVLAVHSAYKEFSI